MRRGVSSSESSSLSDISCDFFVGQTGAGGGPSGAFDMVVVRLGAGAGAGAREGACAVVVVGASPLGIADAGAGADTQLGW